MSFGEDAKQTQYRQIPINQNRFLPRPFQPLAAQHQQGVAPNCPLFVHSPEQLGIPINYQSSSFSHRSRAPCFPSSGGTVSVSENDSAVQLSADQGHTIPFIDLDFRLMDIEPNMSPSSGITSPADLAFTNIGDDQSMDNTDLNNITPSIKSPLTFLGPNDYSPRGGSANLRRGFGGGGDEMPATSCPVRNSDTAYLSAGGGGGAFEGSLSIPRGPSTSAGGGGGNTSGGSAASSTWGGGGGGSNLSVAPNLPMMASSGGGDNQRVAMIKARSKKDSHNRIERKRRDYINCQINELGTLLPEEMFRENDCKKNKGSILKNSVEYITDLQRLKQCLCNEADLASDVINHMLKRIRDLESLLPPEYQTKVTTDYKPLLQEWVKVHSLNQQNVSGQATAGPVGAGQVSVDTSESSPGMSSVGNNEDAGGYMESRGDSHSPVSQVGGSRSSTGAGSAGGRPRCTSTSSNSGGPMLSFGGGGGGGGGGMEVGGSGGASLVGSLPSRCPRILPATSPPTNPGGRPLPMRPLFSQPPLYTSPPSGSGNGAGRLTGKRTAPGRPPTAAAAAAAAGTKMEESGLPVMPLSKQSPVFLASAFGEGGGGGGGGGGAGLSTSLPVRMAFEDFPSATTTASEMNTDEPYMRMTSDGGEGKAFKPEPMVEVPCNAPFGGGGPATPLHPPQMWAQRMQHQPNEHTGDELQFDQAM